MAFFFSYRYLYLKRDFFGLNNVVLSMCIHGNSFRIDCAVPDLSDSSYEDTLSREVRFDYCGLTSRLLDMVHSSSSRYSKLTLFLLKRDGFSFLNHAFVDWSLNIDVLSADIPSYFSFPVSKRFFKIATFAFPTVEPISFNSAPFHCAVNHDFFIISDLIRLIEGINHLRFFFPSRRVNKRVSWSWCGDHKIVCSCELKFCIHANSLYRGFPGTSIIVVSRYGFGKRISDVGMYLRMLVIIVCTFYKRNNQWHIYDIGNFSHHVNRFFLNNMHVLDDK